MNHLKMITILGAIILTGCSPKFYTPNTQNVPLISEQGEVSLTLSGNANQAEFQGAFGVINGFAIKANGGLFIPSDLDNGDGGSGKFVEIGGGYFKPINENFVFETYGIIGLGAVENHFPSTVADNPLTKGNVSANILRYGIQPNFGYKSKYFNAAISSRFVMLNYSKIKGDLIFDERSQADYLKENDLNFLIEPAITIKGGLERIKLQLQYGYSLNATNNNFKQDNSFFTVGLNFNFK